MTLIEFITPLKKSSSRNRILALFYYKHKFEGLKALTVEQVRQGLKSARVSKWSKVNISDVINKCGHYLDSPGKKGNKRLWKLTQSGFNYVQKLLNLPIEPEIEQDVDTLLVISAGINDLEVRDYVEEAIKCLRVDARRACVVFLWAGAIRTIQKQLIGYESKKLNDALQKHDLKSRKVMRLDSFAYIKDKITLLAALELGLYDKNEKDTLEESLNLRNRCGHPGNYKPGVKKVSSFIEDVVSVVFS